jgi:3-oxoacyl-[acyl-carrier-protein] synthase II
MGEEAAGFDSVRISLARIAAGQSDIALVGGAHNGERKDQLMLYECGGYNLKGEFRPVWERGPNGGFAIASLGAFLVLESREHAEKRGAKPLARLSSVVGDRSRRAPGAIKENLSKLWGKIAAQLPASGSAILSGACGTEPATSEERAFLAEHADIPVRASASLLGHGFEPQFIMNIALAALAVNHGKLFAPCDGGKLERTMDGVLTQAVVTGVGHWRGEGLALVEAVR